MASGKRENKAEAISLLELKNSSVPSAYKWLHKYYISLICHAQLQLSI